MELVCPHCKTGLRPAKSILRCGMCEREYVFKNDIADFLGGSNHYWGEIPRDRMKRITEIFSAEGTQQALRWIARNYPNLLDYVFNERRVDWLFHCLSPDRTKSCLDLGSGWGTLTFSLAKHFEEVWSLESISERISFQEAVRERLGYCNIRFCRADAREIPFPENSFDLVVANGILEWMGVNDEMRDPRELQVEFLKEASRVLSNGGCLYVGIENRFGYQFLLGGRDHGGLRFTSLLPRRMSNLIVRLLSKQKSATKNGANPYVGQLQYQTYTYDLKGYVRLLKDAGFAHCDFYWVWPGYNLPTYAGPLDNLEGFDYLTKQFQEDKSKMTKKGRFVCEVSSLLPASLFRIFLPFVVPAFLIFAYKERKPDTLENAIMRSLPDVTGFLRSGGGSGATSKINYWLLRRGERAHLLKLPRFSDNLDPLKTEEALLAEHTGIHIEQNNLGGFDFFVEDNINAARFDEMNLDHNTRAMEWLLDFQTQPSKGNLGNLETEVDELVGFANESLTEGELRILSLDKIRGFSPVKEHGDFWSGNILVGDRRVFILDWEYYRTGGHPLFDFCFFIISHSASGEEYQKSFEDNFLGKGEYSSILDRILSLFCERTQFDRGDVLYGTAYVMLRCKYRYLLGNVPRMYNRFRVLLRRWISIMEKKEMEDTPLWS